LVNLETTYAGLKLRSPIIVASAGITETVDRMRKCQENGAGAVVMKSYFEEAVCRVSPTPRFRVIHHDMGREKTFTFMSYEQASEWDIERYAQEVADAKSQLDIRIIPSLNCITPAGWVGGARLLEQAGADAIELNTSCPHGSITFRGRAVEQTIIETVKAIRDAVSLPLVAKLSPMLTSPVGLVKELEKVGVNGVTIFNRMTALEIDIETETPVMHQGYMGHGGPWAIMYPLRWISEIRPQVHIDIAGSGGVSSWEDVVKYILAGATVVQTCTGVYLNGYAFIRELLTGLEQHLATKGYGTLDDLRGRAAGRIRGTNDIDRRHRYKARIHTEWDAPCKAACPAHVPAQSYVRLAAEGRFAEALDMLRSRNPFQSVCGRVCYHPCEDACTRRDFGGAVAIKAIKRFLCDWGREHHPLSEQRPEKAPPTGKQVAIVGAGPAGLSAAHDLAGRGHRATVFEAESHPGGMLRLGIPAYRLPRDILDEEIAYIESLGVEIRLNHRLGRDFTLDRLRANGFDVVLLALGAHQSGRMGVPNEEGAGVVPALDFLKEVNLGRRTEAPTRVAVVGGGNSAIDAARCALRLGAEEVYLVYRRTRYEMPASESEIDDAEAEGVRVLYLAIPVEVMRADGRVVGLKCRGGYLRPPVQGERRAPAAVDGADYVLHVDMIIPAVSQSPGTDALAQTESADYTDYADVGPGRDGVYPRATEFASPKWSVKSAKSADNPPSTEGFRLTRSGAIVVDDLSGYTGVDGVFAAGDAAGRPGSVIEAIAHGKRVALYMDAYLRGEQMADVAELDALSRPVEKRALLRRFADEEDLPRIDTPMLPPDQRRSSFSEVDQPLTEEQVRQEAARCLACGCGVGCGVCERICIFEAIERDRDQPDKFQVNLDKCDGCGLCVEQCPNRVIEMVEAEDEAMADRGPANLNRAVARS